MIIPGPGKSGAGLYRTDGTEERRAGTRVQDNGVAQGMHNLDASIASFAAAALSTPWTASRICGSPPRTPSPKSTTTPSRIFSEIFEAEAQASLTPGITYFYTLIDDIAAKVIRSRGGMVWACKNYDGDVMSDIAAASGSLPMMTSVLVSPDGCFEYEAAHGTVTDHFYRWRRGEKVSTNPLATMFAWAGALRKRGELDGIPRWGTSPTAWSGRGWTCSREGHFSSQAASLTGSMTGGTSRLVARLGRRESRRPHSVLVPAGAGAGEGGNLPEGRGNKTIGVLPFCDAGYLTTWEAGWLSQRFSHRMAGPRPENP